MVRCWYFDDNENPSEDVSVEDLRLTTGVLYWKLNMDTFDTDGRIEEIRKERKYGYQDVIDISPENLENYEARVKGFHTEHLHPEEEIRMVLKGTTYFDVRDRDNKWIRIQLTPGDLLVLPPAIYHRLTLVEEAPNVVIYRLFQERPTWTSINRYPSDSE